MGDVLGGTGRIEPADPVRDFVVEAVLQPFAECAAAPRRGRLRAGHGPDCPVCGRPASAGVLREEGHGAKRTLWCGLCLTEWDYQRLVCVACDEQRFDALPVYTADAYAVARIEGCDTCHTYLKTIDLTKTGVAVPMVDDLATLPMDLWARQSGYNRLRSHLLGA
jgi:FdhE protein